MADFLTAHKITAKVEGGYANDPDDNGGETFKGISRRAWPLWKGWAVIDSIKNRGIKSAEGINQEAAKTPIGQMVLDHYKANFWDSLNLDKVEDIRVATELYDTGVNMGTGIAAKFFQRALNAVNRNGALFPDLPLTGTIGNLTLSAFNSLSLNDKYMVWKLINCLQGARYIEICEKNPRQEKFMRSWASRVFETIN